MQYGGKEPQEARAAFRPSAGVIPVPVEWEGGATACSPALRVRASPAGSSSAKVPHRGAPHFSQVSKLVLTCWLLAAWECGLDSGTAVAPEGAAVGSASSADREI